MGYSGFEPGYPLGMEGQPPDPYAAHGIAFRQKIARSQFFVDRLSVNG